MSRLRRLNLDYTNVSDKGLTAIASLPALEWLSLDTANVTDEAVETLSAMQQLRELNLYHTLVGESAYEKLKKALPNCRIVWDRESALPNRRKS
jgi:hypothetical protein